MSVSPLFTITIFSLSLVSYGLLDSHPNHKHGHSSSPWSNAAAFTPKDLFLGNKIESTFPSCKEFYSSTLKIMNPGVANSLRFSDKSLPGVQQLFGVAPGSSQAKGMKTTLEQCSSKGIEGEMKTCVTSLKSMLDFARKTLGLDSQIKVLTTTHLTETSTHPAQKYTVLEDPKEIMASKFVVAHLMPYPYPVFGCHSLMNTKLYKVLLRGDEDGGMVEAITVCHMDTSKWSPEAPLLLALGHKPGTTSACHFLNTKDLVIVKSEVVV